MLIFSSNRNHAVGFKRSCIILRIGSFHNMAKKEIVYFIRFYDISCSQIRLFVFNYKINENYQVGEYNNIE